jgi:hypothetical protein
MGRIRRRVESLVGGRRGIGTRVRTPTLRRHTIYRLQDREHGFLVWHERHCTVSDFSADLAYVIRRYEQREAEEDAVTEALATGDPLATCRIGWHRLEGGAWFTLANGGRRGRLIVYWVWGASPSSAVAVGS